jgi:hypothetical protein
MPLWLKVLLLPWLLTRLVALLVVVSMLMSRPAVAQVMPALMTV